MVVVQKLKLLNNSIINNKRRIMMEKHFTNLLSPLKIGRVTIKNRFCLAPMGGYTQYNTNGELNPNGIDYFVNRAKGGFGLVFTGALFPDMEVDPFFPQYATSPMYSPNNFKRTALQMTERSKAYGAKVFAQVSMGLGRNYAGLYAPSELPVFWDPNIKTKALSKEQIKKKIEAVVNCSALMKDSGFDGVEVHAMHWGYLLDQFAMSLTNQRTDEYGGSLENRMRCAKEIIEGIKQVCGADYPVTMRLSLKTYLKGFNQASVYGEDEAGRTLEEAIRISKMLESYGYDALNVDAGVYDSFYYAAPPNYVPEGFMFELSEKVKKEVAIPLLTGGCRLVDPWLCENAVAKGQADAVVMGRPSLADPDLPRKVEMGIPEKIRPCIGCNLGCMLPLLTGGDSSCAINPQACRDGVYSLSKALKPKKVLVAGGGIAGMEFARTAAIRGHEVTLYEKTGQLGGLLLSAGAHTFKKEIIKLNEWYKRELSDLGVCVQLNTELSVDAVKQKKPDVVALAAGSVPILPALPGMDDLKAGTSVDFLLGKKQAGKKVVIVGGGLVGCEMAFEYAREGKKVTLIEALDSILSTGEPVPLPNSMMLKDLLAYHKVEILTGYKLDSVNAKGAVAVSTKGTGDKKEIEADSVVIAIGFKALPSIAGELRENGIEVYEIGDGKKVGNIKTAVYDAYEIARSV
jgi:2-enoate reductase